MTMHSPSHPGEIIREEVLESVRKVYLFNRVLGPLRGAKRIVAK